MTNIKKPRKTYPITPLPGPFEKTALIELRPNIFCIVDEEDYLALIKYTWGQHSQGYAIRSVPRGKGRKIFLHRQVMGASPDDLLDHRNNNVLDCRKSNLRLCNKKQNSRNRLLSKNNTSGYKGVTREHNRWRARLWINDRGLSLGVFENPVDAESV